MAIKSARWEHASKTKEATNKNSLYKKTRWKKESRQFKDDNPFCSNCAKKDVGAFSKVTDHIIPIKVGGAVWDRRNWQPLCRRCDTRKRFMQKSGTFIIKFKKNKEGELIPAEEVKYF